MTENNNQVTIRFESTLENRENDNTETLLLSGPIEIFATAEVFDDLNSQETLETIYNSDILNPIIYVADVRNIHNENDYTNRGAYFRCEAVYLNNGLYTADWREILLGTHSHSNINALEKLYELSKQADVEGKVIALDKNGEFCLKSLEESKELPELPLEIQKKLEELKKYNELYEPLEYEWNHLDAPLNQLKNKYDWMEVDNDGSHTGNCRELYRNMLAREEKLYISNDYTLADEGKYWLSLDVFKMNFDTLKTYEDAINAKVSPINDKFFAAGLELMDTVGQYDEVFLINNGVMLSDYSYSILEVDKNKISVLFNRTDPQFTETTTLTVLVVKDVDVKGFRTLLKIAFDNGDISLAEINNKLSEKYVRNEFAKKPVLPKLYLTTDEYGNMVWDNKLLPSQTFYAKTVRVNISNIEEVVHNERDCVKIIFENANYRVNEDFPLLMVNDFFVFGVQPEVTGDKSKDLVYYLPVNPISGEGHYDFELVEPNEYRDVTLVLIKNSSAGSIADEIAEKYVSKEDAVAILSHGKINLKDFAKRSELLKFSKVGHLHSQYALKDHTHDARYANFHHTHPEFLTAVAAIYGNDDKKADIAAWLKDLDNRQGKLLDGILSDAGFTKILGPNYGSNKDDVSYILKDSSIELSKDNSDALIELAKNLDIVLREDGDESPLTVYDALDTVIKAFELDTVNDTQVLLETDIPVRLINGPIGGITTNKRYHAGENLKTILTDILNPRISVDDMRKLLTPDIENTRVKWYKRNISDVEPIEIRYNESLEENEMIINYDDNYGQLLFTIELDNYNKNNCTTFYTDTVGNYKELKTSIEKVAVGDEEAQVININSNLYYLYDDSFEFDKNHHKEDLKSIYISWKNDKIYDSYGYYESELNPNGESINYNLPNVNILIPDFLTCFTNSLDNIGELEQRSKIVADKAGYIMVAIRKDVKIIDVNTDTNITRSFINGGSIERYGANYDLLYYELYDAPTEPIEILVH